MWPEPTKNTITLGGKMKVSLLKKVLCRVGLHGKSYHIEVGEYGQIIKRCSKCRRELARTA